MDVHFGFRDSPCNKLGLRPWIDPHSLAALGFPVSGLSDIRTMRETRQVCPIRPPTAARLIIRRAIRSWVFDNALAILQ